ncbi:MAG: hypothetical protein K2X27_13010 [Candidatus Obscuribacterales bacterium]|nr:hypothetical protein [Candidatus Obscuribacterales bacterium]
MAEFFNSFLESDKGSSASALELVDKESNEKLSTESFDASRVSSGALNANRMLPDAAGILDLGHFSSPDKLTLNRNLKTENAPVAGLSRILTEYTSSAFDYARENPLKTAAAVFATAGAIALLSRGRTSARLVPLADDALVLQATAASGRVEALAIKDAGLALSPGVNAERSLANGGFLRDYRNMPIPDLKRADIAAEALLSETSLQAAFDAAGQRYTESLSKLYKLPRVAQISPGQSLESIALQNWTARAEISGEMFTQKVLNAEIISLSELNPQLAETAAAGMALPEGAQVRLYDLERLHNLGYEMRFGHVPQLGEIIGLSKAAQNRCVALQMADPAKPRIGEVFKAQGLATEAVLEKGFQRQKALRTRLEALHEKFVSDSSSL